jgi:5-formyltetrahydrofolate cyclo-ligase
MSRINLKDYKKELRKAKINAREALTVEERTAYSSDICRRITQTAEYRSAGVIFLYKYIKGEVRLDELENAAAADGKTLVYPLCLSKTEMIAVRPGTDEDAWTAGAFGIREPDLAKGEAVRPEDIDLVIAPCSSFDDKCRRLGMGGGYYDRYLPECTKARVIAVAYEVQRADEIPVDEYDKPVDAVITEKTKYEQEKYG